MSSIDQMRGTDGQEQGTLAGVAVRSRNPGIISLVSSDGRILLVDAIRGVLILLMASSHAVALSNLGPESFWCSAYWLPRGWATAAFIGVSGMTAAIVYDWVLEPDRARRALNRRAIQLLLVMMISNVALLVMKDLVTGQVSDLGHPSWWIGLLTFKTPYSISGVLLPTAVLLVLLPFVNRMRLYVGAVTCAVLMLGLSVTVEIGSRNGPPLIQSIVLFGAGYPVIPMVCTGILGFFLGVGLKRFDLNLVTVLKAAVFPLGFVLLFPFRNTSHFISLVATGLPIARVAVIGAISTTVSYFPKQVEFRGFLETIGRYSLFCFIGHRVIMNLVVMAGKDLRLPPPQLYVCSLVFTLSTLYLICRYRAGSPTFNERCRRFYI